MNNRVFLTLLAVAAFSMAQASPDLPEGYPETARRKVSLNPGWRFQLGELTESAAGKRFDDQAWEEVNLPHTLKLTSIALDGVQDSKKQDTFHRDIAWYRRSFRVDPTGGSQVFIEFEGAHQVTDVWVNGRHVGQHSIGGYTPFHFDITPYVDRDGPNALALRLDNRVNQHTPPDPGPFDYVKFSGLYRDVYLVQTDPVRVTFPWEALEAGVFVTTPTVHRTAATISTRTTVRNDRPEPRECSVLTRVIDAEGNVAMKILDTAVIPAGSERSFSQVGGIDENLRLWSPKSPYLYRVNTTVFDGGKAVDCVENPLGVRKIELRKDVGLFINDEPIELIGVNRHQHFGYIGDAMPNSLHWKDALQFKRAGFNVVRLAHYPHDDAFLDACDRLGILLYEEGPSWIAIGDEEWQRNLELASRRAIRNHRNHPSVFIWGAGINHRSTIPSLHFAAKQEDPTRLTASNNAQWTGFQGAGHADVFTNMDYAHMGEPNEMFFASEHGSSRDGDRNQIYVSRYKGSPRRFGMAAWTAHAYYTFHPSRDPDDRTRSGMMDVFRAPYPVIEWYRSELTEDPMVFISDPWNADTSRLRVFSNCDEVELLVNGRSLGRRLADVDPEKMNLNSPPFTFPLDYEPGEVVARGYRAGAQVATHQVRSPGKPHAIQLDLDLDGRSWTADGSDIAVAYAKIVDEFGAVVPTGDVSVTFTVEGPGAVVGDAAIGANPKLAKDGIAPALIRSGREAGEIVLKATAAGLKSASAAAVTHPFNPDVLEYSARPIFDRESVRVDIGGSDQLVQFGWTPWKGSEGKEARLASDRLGGFSARLEPVAAQGVARWRGESNVIGRNGYVAGDGICVIGQDGVRLELSGLAAGVYRLITYHHVPHSNTNSMDPAKDSPEVADFSRIKSATSLAFSLGDADGADRAAGFLERVSVGTDMKVFGPREQTIEFRSDGKSPVVIVIAAAKDANASDAVWLNGFELSRPVADASRL